MKENKTELMEKEIENNLRLLDGWEREGDYLKKTFQFDNFSDINKFLPHLTKTIVEHNHHPDFSFDSGNRTVDVKVTTHSEKAITQCDFDLAQALNNWSDTI